MKSTKYTNLLQPQVPRLTMVVRYYNILIRATVIKMIESKNLTQRLVYDKKKPKFEYGNVTSKKKILFLSNKSETNSNCYLNLVLL